MRVKNAKYKPSFRGVEDRMLRTLETKRTLMSKTKDKKIDSNKSDEMADLILIGLATFKAKK